MTRLRALADLTAAASSAALVRAEAASQAAVTAELRAVRAESALASAGAEVAGLRADLAALREEIVWAFAARAAEPKVIDLTGGVSRTA